MKLKYIFLALSVLLCSCTSIKQSSAIDQAASLKYLPALHGGYFDVNSSAVGRPFHIYIRLPQDYSTNNSARYPVVYLLDGDSLFPLLSPTHLFLTYDEKLPEAILVGICYGGFDTSTNKRDTDFSATGAPHFLDFLKRELVPAVEHRYRVDTNRRILLGQSRGADFVLWSVSADSTLFWGRIASSPDTLLAPVGTSSYRGEELLVAVAYGTRDKEQRQLNAKEWVTDWSGRPDRNRKIKLFPIADGTHAASIGEVYRETMLWLFANANERNESPH